MAETSVAKRGKAPQREYLVRSGELTRAQMRDILHDLDTNGVHGNDDMDRLMRTLMVIRMGAEGSPFHIPEDVYTGADCALVRKKLAVPMSPTKLAKAVYGATHCDKWARDKGLSLRQIIPAAHRYLAVSEAPAGPVDKERATEMFERAFEAASNLMHPDESRWRDAEQSLRYLTTVERVMWARRMAAAVDEVRTQRGQPPVAVEWRMPELAARGGA
jgi:hypothetical protein